MAASSAIILLAVLFAGSVYSTVITNCQGKLRGTMKQVNISNCTEGPCAIKRGTTGYLEIRFKPEHDVKQLRNRVTARIIGINFPFLGVDGYSSCDHVYDADGVNKVGCPLKANKEYVYKNSFDIYSFYPSVNPLVHWGLLDDERQDVACFEIEVKILPK